MLSARIRHRCYTRGDKTHQWGAGRAVERTRRHDRKSLIRGSWTSSFARAEQLNATAPSSQCNRLDSGAQRLERVKEVLVEPVKDRLLSRLHANPVLDKQFSESAAINEFDAGVDSLCLFARPLGER